MKILKDPFCDIYKYKHLVVSGVAAVRKKGGSQLEFIVPNFSHIHFVFSF